MMNEPSIYCKCQGQHICDDCYYSLLATTEPTGTVGAVNPIKDTILDVLDEYHEAGWFTGYNQLDEGCLDQIAQEITDALATKLRLKQGYYGS